jgi:hypothetical protein
MGDDGFYVYLPSNSSMTYFENNTLQRFTTRLAEPIVLTTEYEAALCQLSFPNNFNQDTILLSLDTLDEARLFTLRKVDQVLEPQTENHLMTCTKPGRRFDSLKHLAECMNSEIMQLRQSASEDSLFHETNKETFPQILYDEVYRRYFIKNYVKENVFIRMVLGKNLAERFGFQGDQFPMKPTQIQDVVQGTNAVRDISKSPIQHLYVYTDLITHQFVGDIKAPLLRIVSVDSESGDETNVLFNTLHYFPLLKKNFQTIEIDIRTELGEKVPFGSFGRTVVVLHLRPKRI